MERDNREPNGWELATVTSVIALAIYGAIDLVAHLVRAFG